MSQTPPSGPSDQFPFPPAEDNPRADRVEQQGVFEMVWDCQFCGTKGLPARTHKFCPNCGAPQETKSRRFPSDAEKKAVTEYTFKGASLICGSCGAVNEGDAKFCRQCGAPLENAERAQTVASQVRVAGAQFAADAERNVQQEELDTDLARARGPATAKKGGIPWLPVVIIGIVALLCIGAIVALTWQRDVQAQVVQLNWERTIAVETFSAVPSGNWCDSMPVGAYSIQRSERQRGTNRIPDGEECSVRRIDQGDGTFREQQECRTTYREEPIYDDYCSYTLNLWVHSRDVNADGIRGQLAPSWPSLSLSGGSGLAGGLGLGAEREGGRSEAYQVILSAGDKTYTCTVGFDRWQQIEVGASYALPVGVVTGAPDCSALEHAR